LINNKNLLNKLFSLFDLRISGCVSTRCEKKKITVTIISKGADVFVASDALLIVMGRN
jgi:hypothetical protein